MQNFLFKNEINKIRIDKFLTQNLPDFSRNQIQSFIEQSLITVNNQVISKASTKLNEGDEVFIQIPAKPDTTIKAQNIPLQIYYKDDDIVVFEKPAGITMHIGAGHQDKTIVNALLYATSGKLSSLGGDTRPGIVHRLDKDTSGVMVAACSDKAYVNLTKQFSKHSIKRKYECISWNIPSPFEGTIENKMSRSQFNRQKMSIVKGENGKEAITDYKTKKTFINGKASHLLCTLHTGRTHQIRVHMASISCPLIGDLTYGKDTKYLQTISNEKDKAVLSSIKRQMLHAVYLAFTHPITKEKLIFKSKLPDDMNFVIKNLG